MKVTKDTVIKVGDIVRIKPLSWYNSRKDEFGNVHTSTYFVPDMAECCGKKVKVLSVYKHAYEPTTYSLDIATEFFWIWDAEMFSSVTPAE